MTKCISGENWQEFVLVVAWRTCKASISFYYKIFPPFTLVYSQVSSHHLTGTLTRLSLNHIFVYIYYHKKNLLCIKVTKRDWFKPLKQENAVKDTTRNNFSLSAQHSEESKNHWLNTVYPINCIALLCCFSSAERLLIPNFFVFYHLILKCTMS